jgi:hypothetical protein
LISVDPGSRVPVLLLFARDEMADRDWLAPARHWPDRPRLVGGRDLREGGTWLAVRSAEAGRAQGPGPGSGPQDADDSGPRVVCVLNGFGRFAEPARRQTRGRLPLLVASGGSLSDLDLTRYDPFHLLVADAAGMSMLTWDGYDLTDRKIGPGAYLVSNRGAEAEGGADLPEAPELAVTLIEARVKHFLPLLQSTPRPEPQPGAGPTEQAWDAWMRLADGDGLDRGDVRALIGRHDWGEGGVWLTTSVALIGIGRDGGVRFDFNEAPGTGNTGTWHEIETR